MNLALTVAVLVAMKAYHITNWDDDHENWDSRKCAVLNWFPAKVKLVGEGFGHTLNQPDGRGPHLYGMFKIIEQLAASSRKSERGWLIRNGSPLDAPRMAALLRLPVAFFEEALGFFSTPPLDWLEFIDFQPPTTSGDDRKASGQPPTTSGDDRKASGQPPTTSGGHLLQTDRQTDRQTHCRERERDKRGVGKFRSAEGAAQAQRVQWAATKNRIEALENLPEEEWTAEQVGELKKMRRQLRLIEKKQHQGDLTLLKESE